MKHLYDITQRGLNPDYPKEAYIWTPTEPIPEWISDRAKIEGFKDTGEPLLSVRPRTSGGMDILDTTGKEALVTLETPDSFVLYSSTHPLMSVTPHQLELLYELHLRD